MGAARANISRPSDGLYASARRLGLDAAGLEEIWRTRKPLVIRKENGPNRVTTVTYDLSPDGSTITKLWHSSGTSSFQEFQENFAQPYNPISEPESILAGIFLNPFLNPFGSGFAQSFFENWALPKGAFGNSVTTTSTYSASTNGFPGFPSFPDIQRPPPPFQGNPNERNPSERNPNERNPNTPNLDDFNPNDPQWVPVPEATTRRPFVPLPTRAPPNTGAADTVIDDFLAKVDVTTSDIKEEDGEYVRTIVDNNGRVLKAKFELVDTKSKGEQSSTN